MQDVRLTLREIVDAVSKVYGVPERLLVGLEKEEHKAVALAAQRKLAKALVDCLDGYRYTYVSEELVHIIKRDLAAQGLLETEETDAKD